MKLRLSRAQIACGLAVAAVLATPLPGLVFAEEPQPAAATDPCDSAGLADGNVDDANCLTVTVTLAQPPALGAESAVTIDVVTRSHNQDVDLQVELPAGLEWTDAPGDLSVTTAPSTVPMDRGKRHQARGAKSVSQDVPWRLTGTVKAMLAGPAEIKAVAASASDQAQGSTFLTVDATQSTSGITVSSANTVAPITAPATRSNLLWPHKSAGPAAGSTTPTPKTACVTGTWNYVEHTGYTRVTPNASVTALDTDAGGTTTVLATGLTDGDGRFRLCFDNKDTGDTGNGGQDVSVRLSTVNQHWIIQHEKTKKPFDFVTATKANVKNGTTADFGALQPGAIEMMRGVEAFDTLNSGWNFTPGDCWDDNDTQCRQGKINWAPDSKTCCFYNLQEDAAYIDGSGPDTPIMVLHEHGHGLMDDIYDDAFPPVTNCNPHSLAAGSSLTCAWTEAWPTYWGIMVSGDQFYRWPDGRRLDIENHSWGTVMPGRVWQDGDRVEGRVAGALLDLSDNATNEKADTCYEDPRGPLWTTFLNHRSNTFAEFWQHRAQDGYDVGPNMLSCLHFNTIEYGSYAKPSLMANGDFEKGTAAWAVTGGSVGTWTSYRPHEGTWFSWMGGNGVVNTDTTTQQVTIPAGVRSASLTFYLRVVSREAPGTPDDKFTVQVTANGQTSTLATWTSAETTPNYTMRTVDLTTYAGSQVELKFVSTEDAGAQTDFLLDTVELITR
ncbi:hypothetical protein SAMN05192558_105396 [Actinokineospora alba]|uniref:Uncharacterized protein n=1 Tax=Actinokineospora alba TaxID=504798 RepID=A0A1H0NMU1_9PSEU|nr:hypothetical protein [Actinokineospora alba]TDP68766.1 hypothetical protein C8E96_4331 [Actinokineospora alba]SDH86208.1 hypothetical protein SAMN05421871_102446 [Actinokineospora alba]SDO93660.1 hypothetical protein SAMN05192558_105396 [Actinokineospora alba]